MEEKYDLLLKEINHSTELSIFDSILQLLLEKKGFYRKIPKHTFNLSLETQVS